MNPEVFKVLLERLRADKRTTWIAVACAAIWGAGKGVAELGFEPWGSGVMGLAMVSACVALAFTMIAKPKEQPKPEQPPSEAPPTAPHG
jgi:4-hydroxybenzoate polyprenyltransferase